MTPDAVRVVVIGHGMVGHRLVSTLLDRTTNVSITVIGEEPHAAYDRVHLSALFEGGDPASLSLVEDRHRVHAKVNYRTGEQANAIDRSSRVVTTDNLSGTTHRYTYDVLVLATGSMPFVPPIAEINGDGCFVYRTVGDVDSITAYAAGCRSGAVIGGGLLGLEAANALRLLGLETHVIEAAPRLMAAQLDDVAARLLRRKVEALGFRVHVGFPTRSIARRPNGSVESVLGGTLDQPVVVETDMVVVAAGIRPRDELAHAAGLELGERGGFRINDRCVTSDPLIYAIGECASLNGQLFGLVAPGYDMAMVVADHIETLVTGSAADTNFCPKNPATTLKLLGVDVASIGNPHAEGDVVMVADTNIVKRLVLSDGKLIGATLVGDVSPFAVLASVAQGTMPVPSDPLTLLGIGAVGSTGVGVAGSLPDAAIVCSCHNVSAGFLRSFIDGTIAADASIDQAALKSTAMSGTKAGTGCGSCASIIGAFAAAGMGERGLPVSNAMCEHFPHSRAELFDIVRTTNSPSFAELLFRHGTGTLGCEICRPAVASMLASHGNTYVLDGEQAALQDTNDHVLANIQRNGTYSVIPRVPGGEIRPEQLISLGTVAKKFGLYAKITGGQRVDLLGAHMSQLPAIWQDLIDAGFESGHAYGKALRTVKSCVGDTWCRYGVQDAVSMAIQLELRYRGLRSPHKIKLAVSGCARECAEAQSKDVGIIATETGWNLYVGGNGGMRPAHAVLFGQDLSDGALIQAIDRYLMFYIRTADRLERTATWQAKVEGGVDYLKAVVFDDRLGIASDLDAAMRRHVETYRCEWTETLADPKRLELFVSFVNHPDVVDPDIQIVTERHQPVPARVPVTIGKRP